MSCRESKDIFILLRPSGSTKTQVPLKRLTMCCSRFQGRGYGAAAARLTQDQKVGNSNHIDASQAIIMHIATTMIKYDPTCASYLLKMCVGWGIPLLLAPLPGDSKCVFAYAD
jgi:hypothetical protein